MKMHYPGKITRFSFEGAHFMKTSRENPPVSIPGVANRTQGPGESIYERLKGRTAIFSNGDKWLAKTNEWNDESMISSVF